jgi:hypothetical protein
MIREKDLRMNQFKMMSGMGIQSWVLQVLCALCMCLGPGRVVRADTFVFEWGFLAGDFSSLPVYLDLDGDPVPKKIWGAKGEITGAPPGSFPLSTAWLDSNYGIAQGYAEVVVQFEFGTDDTGNPHAFVLDEASFSNDPATGTAKMTYVPAGGAPSVPVNYYMGGDDFSWNRTRQLVATGVVTALHLEMNPGIGWSGYGEFQFSAEVPAPGPVTNTQAPLFSEIAGLVGGAAPYRTLITIGEFEFDPVEQSKWLTAHPTGQVADATIFVAVGAGYAGEPSGVSQAGGDVILPLNGNLVDRNGDYYLDHRDLTRLGKWFDPPMVEEYSYRTLDGSYFSAVELPVGLDTEDGQFTLWFDGKSEVVDEGVFFSFVDHHAGGGNLVNTFRITGIEPTVDAEDPQAFPVRLAFWDGSEPLSSASFAIRPAVRYQVDGLIAAKPSVAAAKGDGIYNRSGSGQRVKLVSRGSGGATAYLGIQNDGDGDDRFRLRGVRSNRSLKVSYLSGGNRTSLVTKGQFLTETLSPGDYQVVKVVLKPLSDRVSRRIPLLSTSSGDAAKVDLVKILFSR